MPSADGFVLAGGRSERFGSDKFLHHVDGVSMGQRAVDALAGLRTATVVGPVRGAISGASWWMGRREGEGPLGALVDVLERVGSGLAVVIGCDTPAVGTQLVDRLVEALRPGAAAAVADDGRPHWLIGAWRSDVALEPLRRAWDGGERSIHRAASGLDIIHVSVEPAKALNANRGSNVGA